MIGEPLQENNNKIGYNMLTLINVLKLYHSYLHYFNVIMVSLAK